MFYKRCDCERRAWPKCDHPWWEQFEYAGKRHRVPTGQGALAGAQVEARRKRAEIEADAGPRGGSGITIPHLERLHVRHLKKKGFGELRVETVENLWKHIDRHLGYDEAGVRRDVMSLTMLDPENYEGKRRHEEPPFKSARGQTIRREVQALRRGLRLAKREGLIHAMPFDWEDLEPILSDAAKPEQAGKARSELEIRRVISKLSKKARTAHYHRMLWLIRRTGLRLEEFRRCHPSWIRPAPRGSIADAVLVIPAEASKTGKHGIVPLRKEDAATIRELWPKFATKKFNKALWLASAAAGVSPPLTPRDLRATYLTEIDDPRAAQKLGRHNNIATTGLYVDLDSRRAIEAGARAVATVGGHRRSRQAKKG